MLLALLSSCLLGAAPAPELSPQVASQLIGGALTDGQAYERTEELADRVGPRLSGSPGAAAAVQWALQRFARDGVKAHLEAVKVPHWVRGSESAELLVSTDPMPAHRLQVTALGDSGSTPAGGVTAPVLEVRSLEALQALGDRVKGKLVFFNHGMSKDSDYAVYAGLRGHGPALAAKLGAVGALVRSLATASMRSPHTGNTTFEPGQPQLASVALSVEDAELLHRALARTADVKVHLDVHAQRLPDADSANVVAEVRGREKPDEVVVLGAHLDSWDLATGAQDDASGVGIVMEAAALIAHVHPAPRRTVRFILFMNEENGLAGGKAYAAAHVKELGKHVAALEADSGAGRPLGFTLHAGPGAEAQVGAWAATLATLGADRELEGEAGGADLMPLGPAQVPLVGVRQDASHYFDIHHSAADTVDFIHPADLAQSAGAYTWLTYALAESPRTLPRPAPADANRHQSSLTPPPPDGGTKP